MSADIREDWTLRQNCGKQGEAIESPGDVGGKSANTREGRSLRQNCGKLRNVGGNSGTYQRGLIAKMKL